MNRIFGSLTLLKPSSLQKLSGQIYDLVEQRLWAKILFAMALGVLLGASLSSFSSLDSFLSSNNMDSFMAWLTFPAKLFLKAIQMVIIPLIFSSIIIGLVSTESVEQIKDLGLKFLLFVFLNSGLAAFLGIFLTSLIKPGGKLFLEAPEQSLLQKEGGEVFSFTPDLILNALPRNPISSLANGQMLEVVFLSIIGGVALASIKKDEAESLIKSLEIIQEVCMKVISWAMKLAPVAVFGMMAQVTYSTGLQTLKSMAMYVTVCFLGFCAFILLYAVVLFLKKRVSIYSFFKNISNPVLLAFSTSSSAATMPLSIKAAEEGFKVRPSVAGFIIPLGSTINMAGSTLWQTSAVIFLSQAYGVELTAFQLLTVIGTSIASSIGSPGVPGVGIGILSTILMSIGIPIDGISLIMGVDRIIDMGCTTVNVTGDITASKLLDSKVN